MSSAIVGPTIPTSGTAASRRLRLDALTALVVGSKVGSGDLT